MQPDLESARNAQKRLRRSGKLGNQESAPPDFAALAEVAIANARRTGLLEAKRRRLEEEEAERRAGRIEHALRNLGNALGPEYQKYMDTPPPAHAGNPKALAQAGALVPGRSLHLWGRAGNAKTHLAVWTAAELVRNYAVMVRFLNDADLSEMARDFKTPTDFVRNDFAACEVVLADDVDKLPVNDYTAVVVARLYARVEQSMTLITTANRSERDLVGRYITDPPNALSLLSRMSLMSSVEVTGGDYRPLLARVRGWF